MKTKATRLGMLLAAAIVGAMPGDVEAAGKRRPDKNPATEANAPPEDGGILGKKVSLEFKDASLADVLKALKAESGLQLLVEIDVLAAAKPVTLSGEKTVKEILDEACAQAGVAWEQAAEDGIVVKAKAAAGLAVVKSLAGEPAAKKPAAGTWIYGTHAVDRADLDGEFTRLKSLGINTIVQNIALDESNADRRCPGWKQYYDAAVRHDIRLIPTLWDGSKDQSVWDWNAEKKEFELDIKKYPRSKGARFLEFLRKNPVYLEHTAAVYTFHEPFNPENGKAQRTVEQNRKLWLQIHQEEFPGGELMLYGESVTHRAGCENGAVDYEGTGLFSFSTVRGKPMYSTLNYKTSGPSGITTWMNRGIADKEQVIREALGQVDFFVDRVQKAPPAPDGSRTRFIFLIQTYLANPKETVWSRMPEAWEMEEWAQRIIKPRKDRIAGMMWYCWDRIAGHYQGWLKRDRMDTQGKDRWEAVRNVARDLDVLPPESPPAGTAPK